MKLRIVTTQKEKIFDVEWIEVQTTAGLFVIQQGHAACILSLTSGHELLYKVVGRPVASMMIVQAIAHVSPDLVTLLMPIDV